MRISDILEIIQVIGFYVFKKKSPPQKKEKPINSSIAGKELMLHILFAFTCTNVI